MFNTKQKQLFNPGISNNTNQFIKKGMINSSITTSGNGAMKYDSTGNNFVDQFGKMSAYKNPRNFEEISSDMQLLWSENKLLTLCLVFFIRMITRIVNIFTFNIKTKEVQKGAGLKHEGICRMMWLEIYVPDIFWKNITLFISIGSWKDIITMLSLDLQYHGWKDKKLNWDLFGKLIVSGLENPNSRELLKKYLPQIKANSKCKTLEAQADNMIAKWICSLLYGSKEGPSNYKKYRKLKSGGKAHQWQQLISKRQHKLIDFDTIHGRALSLIVSSKYLKNQGLEQKYQEWIANKPIAKFTGYVYELADKIKSYNSTYEIDTINKQYENLLQLGGDISCDFIVVKDTSTSMNSLAIGTKMTSYSIAKSISIYLSNLLKGYFHKHYIDFSENSILRKCEGTTFYDQWKNEKRIASANTNFLSVADLFIKLKNQNINESEFPKGIICISDGEFDNTKMYETTNIQAFRYKLLRAGFSKSFCDNFKFCFWDIRNEFYGHRFKNTKFESRYLEDNVFYIGGFDPSVISFLTGSGDLKIPVPKNALELFNNAMNQEIMKFIEI